VCTRMCTRECESIGYLLPSSHAKRGWAERTMRRKKLILVVEVNVGLLFDFFCMELNWFWVERDSFFFPLPRIV